MSNTGSTIEPSEILQKSRVGGWSLFLLGTFDIGVTVWSQQVRALNLAYALVETGTVGCSVDGGERKSIAIVGGGFAGLTVAAGLLKKQVNADITIFEQCDALMPLQQGSDSRWLHPHIYDWPEQRSQSGVAMLPVLNWTAARASDVVVQVLTQWNKLGPKENVSLYCNARHLEVFEDRDGLSIEWTGELREFDGSSRSEQDHATTGRAQKFDIIILATGFGIERGEQQSYWRNELV
jgi:NADPH-dependent 2,4-dienoyl-CoA reductase/sulfur reductase-like enzyme